MNRTSHNIAHGDERIPFPQLQLGLINGLAVDHFVDFGIIHMLSVPQEDDMRVVVLNELRFEVAARDADDGERGICHLAHIANRERGRNGGNTILNGHVVGHHGGDDLRREC